MTRAGPLSPWLSGWSAAAAPNPSAPSPHRPVRREVLAQEWGDEYRACLRDDEYWGEPGHEYPGYPRIELGNLGPLL
jgi:hypothetical protein